MLLIVLSAFSDLFPDVSVEKMGSCLDGCVSGFVLREWILSLIGLIIRRQNIDNYLTLSAILVVRVKSMAAYCLLFLSRRFNCEERCYIGEEFHFF